MRIPQYDAVTADGLDTGDQVVIDVDGVTKSITKAELKKAVERVEVTTPTGPYTLVLTDEGKYLRVDDDVTVPPNSSVAWPINAGVTIRNTTTGDIEIVPGSGVGFNGTTTIPEGASIVLLKIATDTWDIIGGSAGERVPPEDPNSVFSI
jgi:hypothetical protein